MNFAEHPGLWFVAATLLPLVSVVVLLLAGFLRNALRASKNDNGLGQMLFHLLGGEVTGRGPAYVATGAIGLAFVCSAIGFGIFLADHPGHHEHAETKDAENKKDEGKDKKEGADKKDADKNHEHQQTHAGPSKWAGSVTWAQVTPKANSETHDSYHGSTLKLGYFIDHLSAIMFVMVTFIATLIHLFSIGYMSDELQQTVEDHQVHTADGHLRRRGRFGRFFLFLSLFCFSMLNLILADNLFQVFVSWELVGVCSYLLIGFYFERTSAGNAANKAFITNRVGDAGFIIGLVIVWTYFGTLNFQEIFARIRCPDHFTAAHSHEEAKDKEAKKDDEHAKKGKDAHDHPHQHGGESDAQVPLGWRVVGIDVETPASEDQAGVFKVKDKGERGEYALLFPRHLEHMDRLGLMVEEEGTEGVRVKQVLPGGPAAKATLSRKPGGLKPGDLIYEIAGKKITSEESYRDALAEVEPGATVHSHAKRDGKTLHIDIQVGKPFPGAGGTVLAERNPDPDGYGFIPYWMLVAAGLGIFLGCVGKSAQFPLQVWLPDAMEGPTPVSALIHAATMVAAGVYLVGRCFPLFTVEVALTIAYTGAITLFMAASIAIVMTDIKKVLAYSTVSQLGYMMLALGVGGWAAGLFHLITHAFFKALMFLASGSVIYGCHHEQEMTRMGGLLGKMKITGLTMLMGVLAIAGIPLFSGWYSKDAVLAHCLGFAMVYNEHFLLFLLPLLTAGITTFYMFRMWFMTFTGKPRDHHVHEHAQESPWTMTVPLVLLAFFAVTVGWGRPIWNAENSWLEHQIHHAQPNAVKGDFGGNGLTEGSLVRDEHGNFILDEYGKKIPAPGFPEESINPRLQAENNHHLAGNLALIVVGVGVLFAFLIYYRGVMNPADAVEQFPWAYRFLQRKWYADELYSALLVRPGLAVAGWCRWFDANVIDGFLHFVARCAVGLSFVSGKNDRNIVDGAANRLADVCQAVGNWLRGVQTGYIRSYVLFLVLAAIGLWILLRSMLQV